MTHRDSFLVIVSVSAVVLIVALLLAAGYPW